MRKAKTRLNAALAAIPGEQGHLPDYTNALVRPFNLDRGQLIPSITLVQSQNCKTINRLQLALAYMRCQQNPYSYPRGEQKS